jgi:hypothetical protein
VSKAIVMTRRFRSLASTYAHRVRERTTQHSYQKERGDDESPLSH